MRRLKKILIWSAAFLLLALVCLHFIIASRSKELVSKAVYSLSGGNYTAKTGDVSFHYFPAGISIQSLSVQPAADTGKRYYIKSKHITLELSSVIALVIDNKMSVAHLSVDEPEILVKGNRDSSDSKKSFPESVKEIQQGLFNTFSLLKVKHATITNGALRIESDPRPERYFSINALNLDLQNIVLAPDDDKDGIPEFQGSVIVSLRKPDIHFANPSLKLKVGHFEANSITRSLLIDSMNFIYAQGKQMSDTVHLERIKINHLNWKKFLKEGSIELDSVIAAKGKTALNFYHITQADNNTKTPSTSEAFSTPTFLIHHLGISDISYKLITEEWIKSREDKMMVRFDGDSLWLKNLSIDANKKPAVDVEALRINFTNYTDANQRKTYQASLGAIEVSDKTLALKNYKIEARGGGLFSVGNKVWLPELRLQNYSLEDLLLKRLIAGKLTLYEPEVVVDILQSKQQDAAVKKDVNKEVATFLAGISKKASLKEVEIVDASLILKPKKTPNDDIVISGLSTNIDGSKAMSAHSVSGIMHAVTQFSTDGFSIKSRNMDLQLKEVQMLEDRGLYFGTVEGKIGNNIRVNLQGVTILNRNFTFDVTSENGLHVSDLLVESGTVDITQTESTDNKTTVLNLPAEIHADNVQLKNIVFRLHQGNLAGTSTTLDIDASHLSLANGAANWVRLDINGSKNVGNFGNVHLKAGTISIQQPGGILLKNASGNIALNNSQINFDAPSMLLGINLKSTTIPQLLLDKIVMERPNIQIDIHKQADGDVNIAAEKKLIQKELHLEQLQLNGASIQLRAFDAQQQKLVQAKSFNGNLSLRNLDLQNEDGAPVLKIEGVRYHTTQLQTEVAAKTFNPSSATLKASHLFARLQEKLFDMDIDSLYFTGLAHQWFGKKSDTMQVSFAEMGISNFHFSNTDSIHWKDLLLKKEWWTRNGTLQYFTPTHTIAVHGLHLQNNKQLAFAFDSMHLHNRISRETFWQQEPYEKDYISLVLGKSSSNNLQLNLDGRMPDISIGKLEVANMFATIERDKTRPEDTIAYRPLLANQIKQIPLPLNIDTLQLRNGKVVYNEIVKQSGLPAQIYFEQVNGSILRIKTKDFNPTDSFEINLRSSIYGKAPMRLRFRQSYTDSLQGFWMRCTMGSLSMPELNAVMVPHLGLRIQKGYIDSLRLRVLGHNNFAYGTMDLMYRQLKVNFVTPEGSKKRFSNSIKSWLANTVIRSKDNGRPNWLYRERVQKRGQFNFWAKIGLEGLLANMGIKSNKKARKKYANQEKHFQFPAEQ
ncbi:MAG TPA: hypothetical protein VLC98_14805 [Phnomibacter sp.]|nr:hypothetical protein [Phnomibacter sp.]